MARMDADPPSDFLTYLGGRLGKDGEAAAQLLGEWLSTYEPMCRDPHKFAHGHLRVAEEARDRPLTGG